MKTLQIVFSGIVQGVGFRFTTKSIANQNKVYGWVKNLPDGNVEVVVEGKEENLNLFVNTLKDKFNKYIHDYTLKTMDRSKKYNGFEILI